MRGWLAEHPKLLQACPMPTCSYPSSSYTVPPFSHVPFRWTRYPFGIQGFPFVAVADAQSHRCDVVVMPISNRIETLVSWVKVVCLATSSLVFYFFWFWNFHKTIKSVIIFQCPFSTPDKYINGNMTLWDFVQLCKVETLVSMYVCVCVCVCWIERKSEESKKMMSCSLC